MKKPQAKSSLLLRTEYFRPLIFFFLFSPVIIYLHYKFSVSFSFVDEYTHFVASFFMVKGRLLYHDIFFQHQPFPVYLSFCVEKLFHPDTLYKLVLYHRLFVLAFSLIIDFLFIYRFKFAGLGFVIVYELTKYYLFGNLFLGETFVAPLLAYNFGIVYQQLRTHKTSRLDVGIVTVFTWFTIFTREPLIPAALFVYIALLLYGKSIRLMIYSVTALILLSILTTTIQPTSSYIMDLIKTNLSGYTQNELAANQLTGLNILKIFFYPLAILLNGASSPLRAILLFLDFFLFAFLTITIVKKNVQILSPIVLLVTLGLCAIRWADPGIMFYAGFHMLPWFALFIFGVFLLWNELTIQKRNTFILLVAGLTGIIFFYPNSLVLQRFNRNNLFTTNYGRYYSTGSAIRALAIPESTLFVDKWDSLVYWQAGLQSSYRYVFSYPVMDHFPQFNLARSEMFTNNPPDFYYTDCPKNTNSVSFASGAIQNRYSQLHQGTRPICLYAKKSLLLNVTANQWSSAARFGINK